MKRKKEDDDDDDDDGDEEKKRSKNMHCNITMICQKLRRKLQIYVQF